MRTLCLLLALLMLAGCAAPGSGAASEPTEAAVISGDLEAIHALGESPDDNYRTFYEIFVYSFRDSDGDGIGDLAGVTSKLDYLQDLGITGIWLMPIHPSPSYHKYDVEDYYAIHPDYGTMEDFETLLTECHKRNIRVITDLVLNHTGIDHPWFHTTAEYLAALAPGQEPDVSVCPEAGYYHFAREEQTGFHAVPGAEGWYYEGRFSPQMPDVNYGSQGLRQEFREIMEFWLQKGVDGFRLDAAKEFYSGQTSKNLEVLGWIQETATSIKPDCYLVAEVWDGFTSLTEYYKSDITSLFNFAFGDSDGKISKVLRGAGNPTMVQSYAQAQEKADRAFRASNPDYIDAPFFSNHDVGRIAGFVGRDPMKTKLAGAMNIFMGGSAFIYYGEEIGMVCGALDDPSYRAPMVWNQAGDSGTTQPPPGCTVPDSYPFGSLEVQEKDQDSIYHYYRKAIAIRNAIPAIARGIPTEEKPLNQGVVSATRKTWGEKSCLILMNISGETETVDLSGYPDWTLAASLSANGGEIGLNEGTLNLPAFGTAILIP